MYNESQISNALNLIGRIVQNSDFQSIATNAIVDQAPITDEAIASIQEQIRGFNVSEKFSCDFIKQFRTYELETTQLPPSFSQEHVFIALSTLGAASQFEPIRDLTTKTLSIGVLPDLQSMQAVAKSFAAQFDFEIPFWVELILMIIKFMISLITGEIPAWGSLVTIILFFIDLFLVILQEAF